MVTDTYKDKGARKKLVGEIAGKGIRDENVLKAIGKVPRHLFFSKTFHAHAYIDKAFPIGEGQTISQPYTVAYQTQLLQIENGDRILEIGTGSGYQAAILAELGAIVYSIERLEKLHERSKSLLLSLGYKVNLLCGDGTKGWPSYAPFDKIIVTAGAQVVPDELLKQLKIGGILVIPVGDTNFQKMVTIIKKAQDTYEKMELEAFSFVPLIGDQGWKKSNSFL